MPPKASIARTEGSFDMPQVSGDTPHGRTMRPCPIEVIQTPHEGIETVGNGCDSNTSSCVKPKDYGGVVSVASAPVAPTPGGVFAENSRIAVYVVPSIITIDEPLDAAPVKDVVGRPHSTSSFEQPIKFSAVSLPPSLHPVIYAIHNFFELCVTFTAGKFSR
mmetsp:Transcript_4257/g.8203  ORF Transcript_4257/g.8203 Transcript_4257/m.8203 type:complete len:162 (-) Transcript_4257:23-508(-)